jgi:hypothetical protein
MKNIYRLLPGHEDSIFQDHGIGRKDMTSTQMQESASRSDNRSYAATLKMPDIPGVSFSVTERQPPTLGGMCEKIRLIIQDLSSSAKQIVKQTFKFP